MDLDRLVSFWGHHLVLMAVWLTLTLSLNLINGYCGLFSLGHQGFWAVGAYAAAVTMRETSIVTTLPSGLEQFTPTWFGFMLSFPVAMTVAGIFGLLVGLPCLRLKGDYLAIATLAFSEILRNVLQNSEYLGRSVGMPITRIVRQSISDRNTAMYAYVALAWTVAIGTLLVLRNLTKSSYGRAITSIREDERAAELLGVNLTRYKVMVFVIGAAFAGLAGAVFAHYTGHISPDHFGFSEGVLMVVMVVLGGMGSFTGTMIATIVLRMIPELLALWLPDVRVPVFYDPTQTFSDPLTGQAHHVVYRNLRELWQVMFSVLLIVVVLVRPQGIMGGRKLRWPWQKKDRGDGPPSNPSAAPEQMPQPEPTGGIKA
jgi:branched-chain amino acid transport system permease protein